MISSPAQPHRRGGPAAQRASAGAPRAASGSSGGRERARRGDPRRGCGEDARGACGGRRPRSLRRVSGPGGEILTGLARRAYRRPATAADVSLLRRFYDEARAAGEDFEGGIERALRYLLAGPDLLFRFEADPVDAAAGSVHPVPDVELASRLSFFLWSSLSDDELLAAAEAGRLGDPAELERQVRRMIADPPLGGPDRELRGPVAAAPQPRRPLGASRRPLLAGVRRVSAAGADPRDRALLRQRPAREPQRPRPADRRPLRERLRLRVPELDVVARRHYAARPRAGPRVVFERMFGDGGSVSARVADMRTDRSILDAVTGRRDSSGVGSARRTGPASTSTSKPCARSSAASGGQSSRTPRPPCRRSIRCARPSRATSAMAAELAAGLR